MLCASGYKILVIYMNWLSHIFISKNSIEYQLGNLLADPLKGKYWGNASNLTQEGFKMHCKIDTFTDANENVLNSKARLGKKGYLKGVIIDIAYDHLLLNNWNSYSNIDISSFINEFYENALNEIVNYPDMPREFVKRIIQSRNLTSYSTFEGLKAAFQRIDKRLSKRLLAKECATGYLPVLERELDAIQRDFNVFFPQLISHFKLQIDGNLENHWFK